MTETTKPSCDDLPEEITRLRSGGGSECEQCRPAVTRLLGTEDSQKMESFGLASGLSLTSLVTAAWVQVLSCYLSVEDQITTIDLFRQAIPHPYAAPVHLASAAHDSVVGWLHSVAEALQASEAASPAPQSTRTEPGRNALNQPGSAKCLLTESEHYQEAGVLAAKSGYPLLIYAGIGEGISLSISYDTDQFTRAFIEILIDCLQHIIRQFPQRAAQALSQISLISPEMQERFLPAEPNTDESAALFVQDLVAEQVRQHPGSVAAICAGAKITYRELADRSQQLAQVLKGLGVGPQVPVTIHIGRSIELLVAILGVLKSGGAFLPLDPSLPSGRIDAVMTDSQAPIVVTLSTLKHRFELFDAHIICLDQDAPAPTPLHAEPLAAASSPGDLAYVIYTSGSTGKPKGVMIEHRNLSAYLTAMDQVIEITSGIMLAIASPSFDMSIIELLWSLTRGVRIVLHEGDKGSPILTGPGSVVEQIIDHQITHVLGTPTLMRIIVSDPAGLEAFRKLKVCIVGGEAFPPELAKALLTVVPGRIINAYGPTEITVCATCHVVTKPGSSIPIGKALSNSRLYVVDRFDRMLPPLAAGELLIGGNSVGRGYLNRPDLTSERFIVNHFDASDRNRLYRSGDLVRLDLEGNFHFLDRMDSQVKIRGYRIELGEIEAVLRSHQMVEEVSVVVKPEPSREKTIVAFYTCRPGQTIETSDLRVFLAASLPHYMVPAVLRCLPKMPVTASGKIDRSALSKSALTREGSGPVLVRTSGGSNKSGTVHETAASPKLQAIESLLCSWCRDLLQVPDVDGSDDFFEIGGESLNAALLMRRIASEFGVNLRLSILVKARTMRSVARCIAASSEESPWSPVIPLRTEGSRPAIFLIAGLGGNVVNFEFVARALPGRPVYGVEAHGLDGRGKVLTSVEDMASAYLSEIRRFQPFGPYHLAGYSFGGVLAFEMAQQLRAMNEQVGVLGLIDTSDWHYSRRVLAQLGKWARWKYQYGNTLREVMVGPNRWRTLSQRFQKAIEHRKLAALRARGHQAEASIASIEQRNYYALTQYQPRHYEGDIQLFRTADRTPLRGSDLTLGWSELCNQVIAYDVSGQHETLTTQPFASVLGHCLDVALVKEDDRERARRLAGRSVAA